MEWNYPVFELGGWLLLFCFTASVAWVSPLMRLAFQSQYLTYVHGNAAIQDHLLSELQIGFDIFQTVVGIYVWTKGKYSISAVRVFLTICLLWAVFSAIHITAQPGYQGPGVLLLVVLFIIMPVVWWLYFRTSLRVRWTFGRNI